MAVKNIMIVGVGGQGTLLTSRILGGLAIAGGYDVKLSEVHGMAQRGGSVVTFVRYGDKVAEPIVEEGQADVIIAFERLEALRYAHFLKKDGALIVNDWRIDPMPVVIGAAEYPENILENLKKDYRVYALCGDGEIQEGQIWEAAMWAGFRKLDNLVVIVDNNNLQIDGTVDEVCSPYPIDKKFEAFNFHTININGNDFDEIRAAFKEARETKGMPTAIIAKTVKGKGVSFMENAVDWHGKAPNDAEYEIAMKDLEKVGEALCQK